MKILWRKLQNSDNNMRRHTTLLVCRLARTADENTKAPDLPGALSPRERGARTSYVEKHLRQSEL